MGGWSFHRRRGVCSACEREFADGEAHFSALWLDADQLAREDVCRTCWEVRAPAVGEPAAPGREPAEERPPGPLFWWRTRHEADRKNGLALDLEAIEALFLGLEGRSERHLRELRYVLSLLLMRKRRLKIERILRDGEGESMLVRRPRRKETLRVFVFDFDAERMQALRDELQHVFDSDEGLMAVAAGGSPVSETPAAETPATETSAAETPAAETPATEKPAQASQAGAQAGPGD